MEAEACGGDDSEPVLALVLRSVRVQDLPLCFPGRDCFDVPPGGARVLHLVSDVTPASPGIAAVLWAGLGAVILVIVSGLRQPVKQPAPHAASSHREQTASGRDLVRVDEISSVDCTTRSSIPRFAA